MGLKQVLTPKKTDLLWFAGLFFSSVLLSTVYIKLMSSMSFSPIGFSDAFVAVISGVAFMLMSFTVFPDMIYPIVLLILAYLCIRCADYYIKDIRVRMPVLIIIAVVLFYVFLRFFIGVA